MGSFDDRHGAAVVVEVGHDGTANGDAGRLQNRARAPTGGEAGRAGPCPWSSTRWPTTPLRPLPLKAKLGDVAADRGGVGVGGEGRGRGGDGTGAERQVVLVAPLKVSGAEGRATQRHGGRSPSCCWP